MRAFLCLMAREFREALAGGKWQRLLFTLDMKGKLFMLAKDN